MATSLCRGHSATKTVSLRLGFASDEFGYAIDLGLPQPSQSAFARDPEIKRESIWHGAQLRPSTLLVDRFGSIVRFRNSEGDWEVVASGLAMFDSMMARLADPRNAPEVLRLRDSLRAWRFYDHFQKRRRRARANAADRHAHAGAQQRRTRPARGDPDDSRNRR